MVIKAMSSVTQWLPKEPGVCSLTLELGEEARANRKKTMSSNVIYSQSTRKMEQLSLCSTMSVAQAEVVNNCGTYPRSITANFGPFPDIQISHYEL